MGSTIPAFPWPSGSPVPSAKRSKMFLSGRNLEKLNRRKENHESSPPRITHHPALNTNVFRRRHAHRTKQNRRAEGVYRHFERREVRKGRRDLRARFRESSGNEGR